MFKSLDNIDTSFRKIRLFAITYTICLTGIAGYAITYAFKFAQQAREKIYVLDNGKSLILALQQDIYQNLPVKAKDHVKRFHQLFFTLAPDEKAIKENTDQAFFLADESALREFNNLKESGFYNKVIAGNVSYELKVDSVVFDGSTYPYFAKTFATQTIIRSTSITTRNLVSECWLLNVVPSDNNPHGFLMQNWRVLENKTLAVVNR